MSEFRSVLEKYDIRPKRYKYIGKAKIIETENGKLVYKEKANNYDIYEYLRARGFDFFPKNYNDKNEDFDLSEYIEEINVPTHDKLKDMIHLSGILHRKTSFNKEMDLDEIKELYENIVSQAEYLSNYYNDLNNYIDTVIFMSPAEYLLVLNIDLFYYLISFVKVESDNWYKKLIDKKTVRYSLIHNNLELDHLLIKDRSYLISWDKSKLDMPIYDLMRIYENNYYEIDLDTIIKEYVKENSIDEDEYLFLLINLALPKRIEFTNNTYRDCESINKYIVSLRKIASLVKKLDAKRKKDQKEKKS